LPPVSLIPVANLPPVSLIPVVNLELQISPRKKFETALMVYSGAWGKLIHEKNQRHKKSRDTVPLSHENCQSWELSPPARNRVGKSVNWWHIQGTILIIFFCSVPTPLPPPMSLWIGIRTGNVELDNRSSADSAHPQFSIRFQHLFL
jgi:hypothetical protein